MTLSWARTRRVFTACFLVLFLFLGGAAPAFSFALNGYRWRDGTQITMHLQLTRDSGALQDGSASWNASAADALNIWNQYVDTVQFVAAEPSGSSGTDGANEVLFSNTVYGESWPANVLAVTLRISSQGSLFSETDVLFNDSLNWDSYRGSLQGSGPGGTYDFHRVALHEFGHVLGLDHPDQHGQSVLALMNSIIGDLDSLADDDISGASSLYGIHLISNLAPPAVEIGAPFSYQIIATVVPSSFEASGLPPGLQLNSSTGLVSGQATVTGVFSVPITAHFARKDVTAVLRIEITPRRITSSLTPSVNIGDTFSYSILADNSPTSFEAIGLPTDLQFDSNTGKITGVPALSGTYTIKVIAHGNYGDAIATLQLVVNAVPPPTPIVAEFPMPFAPGLIVADPRRPVVYAVSALSLYVIDTSSLTVTKTISLSDGVIGDMAISADGNRLWLAFSPSNSGSANLRSIDLNTLTRLPDFPLPTRPANVREGLDGQLFIADFAGAVYAVDGTSGALKTTVGNFQSAGGLTRVAGMEISPDRKTLYIGEFGPAYIFAYDVTAAPQLLRFVPAGDSGGRLSLSPNAKYVCLTNGPNFSLSGTQEFSASDLQKSFGSFAMQSPQAVAFSIDDTLAYQVSAAASFVGVYDTATCQLLRKIELGNNVSSTNVAIDRRGSYLFVAGRGSSDWLRVYSLNGVPGPPAAPHSLLNVSTRLKAQTADDALIGGFIINGSTSKKIVLRAMGPSLPVPGKIADPVLQLFDSSSGLLAQNDNWNSHRTDVLNTGIPPADEHEAVIVTTLAPGNYTAVVRGTGDSTGVALVEAYDLSPNSSSRLTNISTRGKVESGDNVMIGGFILGGDQTTNVVVRAIGPSLANVGVPGALIDPLLEVYDSNGALFASDDNWRENQEQLLLQTGLAPADDRESAMFLQLQPGAYTAIVRGKNNSTGVALVEVYNLDAN